jgi:hypothetical protein
MFSTDHPNNHLIALFYPRSHTNARTLSHLSTPAVDCSFPSKKAPFIVGFGRAAEKCGVLGVVWKIIAKFVLKIVKRSVMTQTFIALAIVALALIWVLWRLVRTLRTGRIDCGCGQGKKCRHRKQHDS